MPTPTFLRTLAAATLLASAAAAPVAYAAEFTASATTRETITPVAPGLCPANLAGVTLGRGTSSVMDQIAIAAADCITPTLYGTFNFTSGRMVLTGTSGEQLFLEYGGVLTLGAPSMLQGSYKVLGGTGRFWGATGSGELSGTLDMSTLVGKMDLKGSLNTR